MSSASVIVVIHSKTPAVNSNDARLLPSIAPSLLQTDLDFQATEATNAAAVLFATIL